MKAMVLEQMGQRLRLVERPKPEPAMGEILVRVAACGVCRTDLHIVDGDLTRPQLPLVPGHEIVGRIERLGPGVEGFGIGERIGIPWLGKTCRQCRYCIQGRENLCDAAMFTGYQIDGGYAEYTVADAQFCLTIPGAYPDIEAAPLLCAGLIGYRALKMTGQAERVGLFGFGAAAHIVAQIARHQGREVLAFTRSDDWKARDFAMSLGCSWAGGSDEEPPRPLDAAILFAPVGALVPRALKAVVKGGIVVLGGIHMSKIPAMAYELIWGERVIRSVANLTRADAVEFLAMAPRIPVRTTAVPMPLARANDALDAMRRGRITGAVVLVLG